MVSLASLWLPIVVAAVAVFLVSSILHMVLKYHRADHKKIPNESEALAGLAKAALPPGAYMFPFCDSMQEMGTPEGQEKFRRGPVGTIYILPNGQMSMGKYLGTWFAYCLLVSAVVACLACGVLAAGAATTVVFHQIALSAFLAYGLGQVVNSIWLGVPWANTFRSLFDGLIYAAVTGGCFAWLWPH
ncbi:MAG: hypothetical protein ABIV06_04665 [Thermoanaerobaculia bacterium]